MVVKAIYQDGVFKPTVPVNLSEGERVDLQIIQPSRRQERNIVSLQGIWKDGPRPQDQGDWVSETVTEIRREFAGKLDRLAQNLNENPAREQ